ncbi:MAG TPA: AlkA N-terminal domain-containing protein [Longimicrobiales bacterium]
MVHEIRLTSPFRLDLTVTALRRARTNPVDIVTTDGSWMRALRGPAEAVTPVRVSQPASDRLSVRIDADAAAQEATLLRVRQMLGLDRDMRRFDRAVAGVPWLAPLAKRMRGLRPPRYPDLWETAVNSILFQQISISAASAITARLVRGYGMRVDVDAVPLHVFPSADAILGAREEDLREIGISAGKITTLLRVAERIAAGTLDSAMLENLPTPDALMLLRGIKGIGPWTATLMLLRGLGRVDVFPPNDSSVTANLGLFNAKPDVAAALDRLGEHRGMLYFLLLLARLESRDEIGLPSLLDS